MMLLETYCHPCSRSFVDDIPASSQSEHYRNYHRHVKKSRDGQVELYHL